MHRNVTATALTLLAALTAGCGDGGQPLAEEWLPKLQTENSLTCQKSDCSDEVRERRLALTAELQADAEGAGSEYEAVANLAGQVHAAVEHWETDCYPGGGYSSNAGMSCDAAYDYVLYGTDQLQSAVEQADAERRRNG